MPQAFSSPYAHAVDILRYLGSCRGDPELEECGVPIEDVIWSMCERVSELTGLSVTDVLQTITRLARNELLEGHPHSSELGVYGKGRADLCHVAKALRELDKDGSTVRLWRWLCEKWPIFGKAWQAKIDELSNQAQSTKTPSGNTGPSTPLPTPQPPEQIDPVTRAIALLLAADKQGRTIKVSDLPYIVGCSRAKLYRDKQFNATVKALKDKRRGNLPKGRRAESGNLEAEYDPAEE